MRRILFLCTGNYYRSRFAEVVFNWHARQRGLAWRAESRGLALCPRNTGPISRHTIDALAARSIPPDNCHRMPCAVTEADFLSAHRIIAVKEAEHRKIIEAEFPTFAPLVEYWHVHDLDCATPEMALTHLEREVQALLKKLSAAAA